MRHIYRTLRPRLANFLLRSGGRLIDVEWYRSQNLQDSMWQRLALIHALLFSSRAQVHSHPLFSPEYFAQQCQQLGLPIPKKPLKTYLGDKKYWGISTHPLFDTEFYTSQIDHTLDEAPLLHFLNSGHLKYNPHPLFQRSWYLLSYPGLKNMPQHCALVHYIKIGCRATISTHPLFHATYYVEQAKISASNIQNNEGDSREDPLLHFVLSTSTEISCHPLFSITHFKEQINEPIIHDDKENAYKVIADKYLGNPEHWKFNTHILFDSEFYLSQSNGKITDSSPLVEYIEYNFKCRNPHPLFNTRWYSGRKKNLAEFKGQSGVPLVHFVTVGHQMGESPHPLFALQWYRHTYMQGELSQINPLIEFLTVGEPQGNRPNPLYSADWQTLLRTHHQCNTLLEFARTNPTRLPKMRNRISDAFSTGYLTEGKKPQGDKNYIILFTPRSGSSWLTELISNKKILGKPSEWFNPDLMQSAMNGFQQPCHNIYDYCKILQDRHKSPEGFFGAELTATHLSLLQDLVDVDSVFMQPRYVLQLRGNIVSQAVSLFLATETGFFHASNTINQNNQAVYNETKIKKWMAQLLHEEQYFSRHFGQLSTSYYISWYEDLQRAPEAALNRITQHIAGTTFSSIPESPSVHRKIGSSINLTYEARLREEHPDFVAKIESARPFQYSGGNVEPD